jgi:hypothetical protein
MLTVNDLVESSMNFDLDNVKPFLHRVADLIQSGFGEPEIAQIIALAEGMEHDDEQELIFKIRHQGNAAELRVRIFMDDIAAPDLYFFSPPALAEKISAELVRFADEHGM